MMNPSPEVIGYKDLPKTILSSLEEYFSPLYSFQAISHCLKILTWNPDPLDIVKYYWENLQGHMLTFSLTAPSPQHPCLEYVTLLNTPCRFQDLETALQRKSNYIFYKVGPYLGDFQARRLIHHETLQCIDLTEKESMILQYLCSSPNHAIEREKLLQEVWQYNAELDTHTLETHIYRLRQKLGAYENLLRTTETGYMLID